jgi:hypothetical protein
MRALFLLACTSAALAAVAACAGSDDDPSAPATPPPGGSVPDSDASTVDAGSDAAPDVEFPTCSAAGWCRTPLPDVELEIRDIWPLPGRAFAIAESPVLGVKVLEWTDAQSAWSYIDDNAQNEVGGQYAGTIWASGDDEVYYAVAPRYIYHGMRLAPPAAGWTWSRHELEDNSHKGDASHATHDHGVARNNATQANQAVLGVWGTGSDHVYAWYANTVYHWTSADGAAPAWVPEYIAEDHDTSSEHLFFASAAGTSDHDVWFSGARAASFTDCPILVHKSAAGYRRIADDAVQGSACAERPGAVHIGGATGWLIDIESIGPATVRGLKGGQDVARVSLGDESGVSSATVFALPKFTTIANSPSAFRSFWSSSDEWWLTAWGLVVRGKIEGDADMFAVSTLSLNGAPIDTPMHRIRGTSKTNLWAIGNGYAFHKTTP